MSFSLRTGRNPTPGPPREGQLEEEGERIAPTQLRLDIPPTLAGGEVVGDVKLATTMIMMTKRDPISELLTLGTREETPMT